MDILLCKWNSVSEIGLYSALCRFFDNVFIFNKGYKNIDYDTEYIKSLSDFILQHPSIECCISINFLPIVSEVCKLHRIPYFSWTYDTPSLSLYSKALSYETNYAFIIDRALSDVMSSRHPEHIFHLPMCAAAEDCDELNITDNEHERFDCDISFVGSLYTEKCNFRYDAVSKNLPPYINGYMDALIQAQLNVYGYNLFKDSLDEAMAHEYFSHTGLVLPPGYEADAKDIVADFYLGYKCTSLERINVIRSIGEHYPIAVYTNSDFSVLSNPTPLPLIKNCGIVGYKSEMPKVFNCSKINLNMTTKTNYTGIPSRVFDIMAAGGFVISNYQSEIPEHFILGEDIVLYDSIPDLLAKINYYLNHDEERKAIAKSGHEKVKTYHTYDNRITQMFLK